MRHPAVMAAKDFSLPSVSEIRSGANAMAEATTSRAQALRDTLPVAEARSTVQAAVERGKAGVGSLYEALPPADVVHAAVYSTLERGKAKVGALCDDGLYEALPTADEVDASLHRVLSSGQSRADKYWNALPTADAVHATVQSTLKRSGEVVGKLREAIPPVADEIQSRLQSTLEAAGVVNTAQHSTSSSSGKEGGSSSSSSNSTTSEDSGSNGSNGSSGNGETQPLICPYNSALDFDTAFNKELEAVTQSEDCAARTQ
jgi:uncharacterized membrane protein YgcG